MTETERFVIRAITDHDTVVVDGKRFRIIKPVAHQTGSAARAGPHHGVGFIPELMKYFDAHHLPVVVDVLDNRVCVILVIQNGHSAIVPNGCMTTHIAAKFIID